MANTKPKIKKLYYSIGEVSEITGLKAYVLRYWETEFKQISPPKNRAGNRTYRQKDIISIQKIKDLLYEQKFTIEGARKVLDGKDNTTTKQAEKKFSDKEKVVLMKIRDELKEILLVINE
ncbi:uncharacterized protein METZ01_LOCUS229874 [marine metagenome]|uniref:HTH merR-type domain-containing protein n=1 Tax=marine metagenome TaxID=408172 RepID=A0A382GPG8_9ZZZZ